MRTRILKKLKEIKKQCTICGRAFGEGHLKIVRQWVKRVRTVTNPIISQKCVDPSKLTKSQMKNRFQKKSQFNTNFWFMRRF